MASILPFQPRHAANRMSRSGDQPAAIIIFPGVRYERRAEPSPTDAGVNGRGGRRRKRGAADK